MRDGYGRNFLVPRGLAMPATSGNIKKVQEQAKTLIGKREKDLKTAAFMKAASGGDTPDHQEEGGRRRQALRLGYGERRGGGGQVGARSRRRQTHDQAR